MALRAMCKCYTLLTHISHIPRHSPGNYDHLREILRKTISNNKRDHWWVVSKRGGCRHCRYLHTWPLRPCEHVYIYWLILCILTIYHFVQHSGSLGTHWIASLWELQCNSHNSFTTTVTTYFAAILQTSVQSYDYSWGTLHLEQTVEIVL